MDFETPSHMNVGRLLSRTAPRYDHQAENSAASLRRVPQELVAKDAAHWLINGHCEANKFHTDPLPDRLPWFGLELTAVNRRRRPRLPAGPIGREEFPPQQERFSAEGRRHGGHPDHRPIGIGIQEGVGPHGHDGCQLH